MAYARVVSESSVGKWVDSRGKLFLAKQASRAASPFSSLLTLSEENKIREVCLSEEMEYFEVKFR